MRKLSVLLMCVVFGGLALPIASAQDPNAGVIFFQHRQFNIPFKNDQKTANVTLVRLYVSIDSGRSWRITATAAPDEKNFRFNTLQDGFFWFAVQTVDAQGKLFPPTADDFKANLRVIVDTVPPSVQVQPLQSKNGEVGVAWLVRDDNLETTLPDAVQLQYRIAGSVTWLPLFIPAGSQQHYWDPKTNASVEVRVTARDRAGNVGDNRTTVTANGSFGGGGGGGGGNPFQSPINPEPVVPFNVDIQRKFVNTRQVSLGYDLRDVGPSGVSSVELWYVYWNSKAWNKLNDYDLKNADHQQPKKLTFQVDEGVYGITLVAKSGVGLSERAPQAGDRPQFWIEVDLTKPVVELQSMQVGSGNDKGKLSISWNARDKNLSAKPIRLSYAEERDGKWIPFAENLANQGRYVWTMPDQVPYQFYLRVEAVDLAGNIGEAMTQDKVKVDLALPKANILDVGPGGR